MTFHPVDDAVPDPVPEDRHGGEAIVRSAAGEGTEVRLHLPNDEGTSR